MKTWLWCGGSCWTAFSNPFWRVTDTRSTLSCDPQILPSPYSLIKCWKVINVESFFFFMWRKFGDILILVFNNRPVRRLEEYHSYIRGQEVEPFRGEAERTWPSTGKHFTEDCWMEMVTTGNSTDIPTGRELGNSLVWHFCNSFNG